ncbi:MAG: PepSY domain-containing protein [Chromatiales bacterium]|nr:PepSY domain-containing protein [Chromatiales bacterium]
MHRYLLTAAALLLLVGGSAEARDRGYTDRGDRSGVSLDEAVSRIRSSGDERVLDARSVDRSGEREYEIKVLTDQGRVRTLRIDPRTGRPR